MICFQDQSISNETDFTHQLKKLTIKVKKFDIHVANLNQPSMPFQRWARCR